MLVLTRKPGQSIHIGNNIVVYVQRITATTVRLAIEAPTDIKILRSEVKARPCYEQGNAGAQFQPRPVYPTDEPLPGRTFASKSMDDPDDEAA